MSDKIRVGIYGAAGYAGQDMVELMLRHPNIRLVFGTSSTDAGEFIPYTDLRYIPPEEAIIEDADLVVLALPHGASAQVAKQALDAGVRVIDLSADLRLDTPEAYKTWYGLDHPYPELLNAPYGLPEINRDNIRGTLAVGAPGCYPTTTLLGLYPLLATEALDPGAPVIVDAKSGVTGAGRSPKANTHFVEVYGNLTPYKTGRKHRHVGEIEQEMHKITTQCGPLIFTPHLLPVARGLMASIYVTLNPTMTSDRVHSLYTNHYADEPLVKVLPLGADATLRDAVLSNHCAISITPVTETHVLITSVTDNLRKGASSQGLQCFNLMYGFEETLALI
ncbi:N-acetyl-gamma-glutamyl-phosphate reductase [Phototrophicus methaneseepsis]|uniref:N-acetyl-gamma-glutamyl-phosphate reductase n=1 Tax=Phototrophicus methaneseepsis TaxID=2710758 RepID=A0A7S8E5G4_9CHLR|nr:N-acetyl-gamma-glutamyl-phosphate reductase [Phototrophicus methaneseepsis]QPC80705.1 N-acetyl-gamma-glutamyl-phosphate reductase [Phototrophicus methaneseepsis]